VLLSDHAVHVGDKILILSYTMAWMESMWGDDYVEYRLERWAAARVGTQVPIMHGQGHISIGGADEVRHRGRHEELLF
jgi:hypothetical protein